MGIDFTDVIKDKNDYLTPSEIKRLLDYCRLSKRTREYVLLYVLYFSGRRISEIVGNPRAGYRYVTGLRPCDIRWEDGLIDWCILKKQHIKTKLKSGKKKSAETLARARFHKEPKRVLKKGKNKMLVLLRKYIDYKGIEDHQRIFNITRQRVDKILRDIAKEMGMQRNIHAHMFRHSFSINFLKANKSNPMALQILRRILDHSTIEMTSTYLQFAQDDAEELLERMETL